MQNLNKIRGQRQIPQQPLQGKQIITAECLSWCLKRQNSRDKQLISFAYILHKKTERHWTKAECDAAISRWIYTTGALWSRGALASSNIINCFYVELLYTLGTLSSHYPLVLMWFLLCDNCSEAATLTNLGSVTSNRKYWQWASSSVSFPETNADFLAWNQLLASNSDHLQYVYWIQCICTVSNSGDSSVSVHINQGLHNGSHRFVRRAFILKPPWLLSFSTSKQNTSRDITEDIISALGGKSASGICFDFGEKTILLTRWKTLNTKFWKCLETLKRSKLHTISCINVNK